MHGGYVKDCVTDVTLNEAKSQGGIVGGATTDVVSNLSGNTWPNVYTQIGLISDSLLIEDVEPDYTWNNHSYKILEEKLTWEQAEARCEALGGHLLTITSKAEQNFIESMLSSSNADSYWLGAKADEDGVWHWVTDEVFEKQYENFDENQPDGSGNYLQITVGSSVTWDDVEDASVGFICEWDKDEETAETEIKAAPNSSLFEKWQSDPSAWENDDSDNPTGARPSPEDTTHLANNPPNVETGTLPAYYDARTAKGLPPIRNQGKYNTCWAFAALGAMEADYMAQGMTSLGNEPDLSELHLAWYVFKDPSLDNKIETGKSNILDQGGNSDFAMSLLNKTTQAPIAEDEMPYSVAGDGDDKTQTDSAIEAFVKDKTFKTVRLSLKETNDFNASNYLSNSNIKFVKKTIMEHGAVFFSFIFDKDSGYDKNNHSFFSKSKNESRLHAVLLVGWDDEYPVTNFKIKPSSKGAWLVRNSQGENFGDGGYFWLSYSQAKENELGMDDLRAFIVREAPEIQENQTTENQPLQVQGHDESGKNKNITSAWSSAIFQSDRDEDLIRIAFYTTDNNASYEIYVNNFGKLEPTDPGKTEEALLSGTIPYAGYHTVDLENPVKLYKGDYYSVIVKMTLTSDYQYPTGVEASMDKYVITVVEEGKSFFAAGEPVPSLWVDGYDVTEGPFNACINVFTTPRISNETPPVILTLKLPDAYVGQEYEFQLSSSGTETIEWRSGTIPAGFALSRSGVLTGEPEEAGEFDIKLTAINDVDIAQTTLKLNVKEGSTGGSNGGCNLNF
ncbi:MAG: hypothetical protein IJ597_02635, partial [Synergistaceae bacterium]|nr:hypothetical protein [Synergistaceae bacterium]